MKYFNSSFADFFGQLKVNNNKEWFDRHREIFSTAVDQPFNFFIAHLLHEIKKFDSEIQISADDAIFRIHRDMRFAKGQPPYKPFRSALISPLGRKAKTVPAFYIELAEKYLMVGGGIYKFSPSVIKKINTNSLVMSPTFMDLYSSYNFNITERSLTYKTCLSRDLITSENLLPKIVVYWKEANTFNKQLKTLIKQE